MIFSGFHSALTMTTSSVCVILVALVLFLSPSMSTQFPLLRIDMTLIRLQRFLELGDSAEYMSENYFFNRTGYPDFFEIGILGICKISPEGVATCGPRSISYNFNFFDLLVSQYDGDMISSEHFGVFTVATLEDIFPVSIDQYFGKIQAGSKAVIAGFAMGSISALFFLVSGTLNLFSSKTNFYLIHLSIIFQLLGCLFTIPSIITSAISSTLLYKNTKGFSYQINRTYTRHGLNSTTPKEAVFSFLFASLGLYVFLFIWTFLIPVVLYFVNKRNSTQNELPPSYDEVFNTDHPTLKKEKDVEDDNEGREYDRRYGPNFFYPWLSLMQVPKA